LFGLYNLKSTRRFLGEFRKIIGAISMCLFAVMALFFFNESLFQSRFILLFTWLFGIILVTIARFLLRRLQAELLRRGFGLHKLVIITGPQADESLINIYESSPELGYKVVSVLSDEDQLLENNCIRILGKM
jgi:FlaA1/EpsC-like NDP-sugar epimerase